MRAPCPTRVCLPLPPNHVQDFVAHQAEEEGAILPALASVLSAVNCALCGKTPEDALPVAPYSLVRPAPCACCLPLASKQ